MAEPFLGEIRLASFNFAPKGWAICSGALLPINQNQALFSLLGTQYGGNGQTNFALPDLRGRTPIHMGSGYTIGQRAGEESHTVTLAEMPQHIHFLNASTTVGTLNNPAANLAGVSQTPVYAAPSGTLTAINPSTLVAVGGNQPHENRQPFQSLTMIIALQGIFPSPN